MLFVLVVLVLVLVLLFAFTAIVLQILINVFSLPLNCSFFLSVITYTWNYKIFPVIHTSSCSVQSWQYFTSTYSFRLRHEGAAGEAHNNFLWVTRYYAGRGSFYWTDCKYIRALLYFFPCKNWIVFMSMMRNVIIYFFFLGIFRSLASCLSWLLAFLGFLPWLHFMASFLRSISFWFCLEFLLSVLSFLLPLHSISVYFHPSSYLLAHLLPFSSTFLNLVLSCSAIFCFFSCVG